jgi:hypothetical protein
MAGEGLDVGTLTGRIELEDRLTNVLEQVGGAIGKFEHGWKEAGTSVLEGAASFVTAEAAIEGFKEIVHIAAETLKEITIEGSHAADIEESFNHLTAAAGLSGDVMLGKLREGLHGTVTELDLMTRVNQNLAVGLNLSADKMEVLSKGAFALAKATGGDAKAALDTLSDAMVTGRIRGIQLLTGKIDLADAETKYAAKLGTTTDHLTMEGKQAAIQEIILEKVASATDRVGEAHVRLADKLQSARVGFANFEEEVGTAIATSPVLAAGFDAIQAALREAFGGSQASAVKLIAQAVDDVLISIVNMAEGAVDAAGVIGVEWNAAKVVFGDLMQIIDGDVLAFEYLAKAIAYVGEVLHIPGAAEEVKRLDDNIQSLLQSMTERGAALQKDKAAEDEWAIATGAVKDKLEAIRQKMLEAKDTEHDFNEVIRDSAEAQKGAADSADKHGAAQGKAAQTMAMSAEEAKKFAEALKEMDSVSGSWQKTLNTIDGTVVESVKYYLEAGVSLDKLATAYGLTESQAKSIEKAWKAGTEELKAQTKEIDLLTDLWTKYFEEVESLGATDSDKIKDKAEKDYEIAVKKLQDLGDKEKSHYDQLWDLRNKDIDREDQQRLLSDSRSKASLDQRLSQARDTYQFMQQHSDQYTQEDIQNQGKIVSSLNDMRKHWGEINSVIDKQTEMVRTLSGEVITLKDYEARQSQGGSTNINAANFDSMLQSFGMSQSSAAAYALARKGYSFQGILEMLRPGTLSMAQINAMPQGPGPRIPGFREGGIGDFGDGTLAVLHGKEAIVPLDKAGGVGGNVSITQYINGTAAEVARKVSDEIMRTLKQQRQFGAA